MNYPKSQIKDGSRQSHLVLLTLLRWTLIQTLLSETANIHYLSVDDHVHALGDNVVGQVFAQEVEDVFDLSLVGQPPQPDAVLLRPGRDHLLGRAMLAAAAGLRQCRLAREGGPRQRAAGR